MSTPPDATDPDPTIGQGSAHNIEAQDMGIAPNLEADIEQIRTSETGGIIRLLEPLDDTNWSVWCNHMLGIFKIYGVEEYVIGIVNMPNKSLQPRAARNWTFNNAFTKVLITNNIMSLQKVHVSHCKTACDMWQNLAAVHESKGHQTLVVFMHNLYRCNAKDGDNIVEHIAKLKGWCEWINLMGDHRFQISNFSFKLILLHSLPKSWDPFTDAYVGSATFLDANPRKAIMSQQFIGIIKEEYKCYEERKREGSNITFQHANFTKARKPPLFNQITKPGSPSQSQPNVTKFCKLCEKPNHTTDECHHLGKTRCDICKKFGHSLNKCWYDQGKKRLSDGKAGEDGRKNIRRCFRKEEANEGEEVKEIACVTNVTSDTKSVLNDDKEYYNFDVVDTDNDERLIYYDCLADSATTSHITNHRDVCTIYENIADIAVGGIGQQSTHACGRGTVTLELRCARQKYSIQLENVLYVPETKNNLFSLGRWEANGCYYSGQQGKINLYAQNSVCVAQGQKIENNLYKICLYLPSRNRTGRNNFEHAFASSLRTLTWELWHKRFGHILYSGLQCLHNLRLVDSFTVDK